MYEIKILAILITELIYNIYIYNSKSHSFHCISTCKKISRQQNEKERHEKTMKPDKKRSVPKKFIEKC